MEVENLKKQNLVAMKTIYSELQSTSCKVEDYPITADLLQSCKHARQRYEQYLDDEKKKSARENNQRKRKILHEEVKEVKQKRPIWKRISRP